MTPEYRFVRVCCRSLVSWGPPLPSELPPVGSLVDKGSVSVSSRAWSGRRDAPTPLGRIRRNFVSFLRTRPTRVGWVRRRLDETLELVKGMSLSLSLPRERRTSQTQITPNPTPPPSSFSTFHFPPFFDPHLPGPQVRSVDVSRFRPGRVGPRATTSGASEVLRGLLCLSWSAGPRDEGFVPSSGPVSPSPVPVWALRDLKTGPSDLRWGPVLLDSFPNLVLTCGGRPMKFPSLTSRCVRPFATPDHPTGPSSILTGSDPVINTVLILSNDSIP